MKVIIFLYEPIKITITIQYNSFLFIKRTFDYKRQLTAMLTATKELDNTQKRHRIRIGRRAKREDKSEGSCTDRRLGNETSAANKCHSIHEVHHRELIPILWSFQNQFYITIFHNILR